MAGLGDKAVAAGGIGVVSTYLKLAHARYLRCATTPPHRPRLGGVCSQSVGPPLSNPRLHRPAPAIAAPQWVQNSGAVVARRPATGASATASGSRTGRRPFPPPAGPRNAGRTGPGPSRARRPHSDVPRGRRPHRVRRSAGVRPRSGSAGSRPGAAQALGVRPQGRQQVRLEPVPAAVGIIPSRFFNSSCALTIPPPAAGPTPPAAAPGCPTRPATGPAARPGRRPPSGRPPAGRGRNH